MREISEKFLKINSDILLVNLRNPFFYFNFLPGGGLQRVGNSSSLTKEPSLQGWSGDAGMNLVEAGFSLQ